MFLQSSPLLSSVVRMEFGREVFHDGLEPLDASRLAQGEKGRCATPAFHILGCFTICSFLRLCHCLGPTQAFEGLSLLDVNLLGPIDVVAQDVVTESEDTPGLGARNSQHGNTAVSS